MTSSHNIPLQHNMQPQEEASHKSPQKTGFRRSLCLRPWLLCTLVLLFAGCMSKAAYKTNHVIDKQVNYLWTAPLPSDKQQAANELALLEEHIRSSQRKQARLLANHTPTRRSLCKTICQAAQGICRSAQRICQIGKQFPKETTFQKACTKATGDCQTSQRSCKTCQP